MTNKYGFVIIDPGPPHFLYVCQHWNFAPFSFRVLRTKCSNFGLENRLPQNYVGRRPNMGGPGSIITKTFLLVITFYVRGKIWEYPVDQCI